MTAAIDQPRSRRIVVIFGGGGDASVTGLLASFLPSSHAEVAGIFLEDHTLFRLAELPFTTELSRVSSARRPLTARGLERELKVMAARAENALRRIAEGAGLSWSFRKHRGRLATALAHASEVDFLVVGTARRAFAPTGELRATASTVRANEGEARRPIAVLLDSSPAGQRALDAGIELADRTGRGLVVFRHVAPSTPNGLQATLRSLEGRGVVIRTVASPDPLVLLSAVRRAAPAVLVAGADGPSFDETRIDWLLGGLRCPVVIAR